MAASGPISRAVSLIDREYAFSRLVTAGETDCTIVLRDFPGESRLWMWRYLETGKSPAPTDR